jgi:hypothetical protein
MQRRVCSFLLLVVCAAMTLQTPVIDEACVVRTFDVIMCTNTADSCISPASHSSALCLYLCSDSVWPAGLCVEIIIVNSIVLSPTSFLAKIYIVFCQDACFHRSNSTEPHLLFANMLSTDDDDGSASGYFSTIGTSESSLIELDDESETADRPSYEESKHKGYLIEYDGRPAIVNCSDPSKLRAEMIHKGNL